jgi:WD40 repeat protein
VAFRPDGRTALTGDERHKARPWDVATGKPLGPPLPHGDMVRAVAFRADGQGFFTGCNDGAVRYWNLPVPWAGEPDQVRQEVEVLTGMELDERGTVHRLGPKDWYQRLAESRGSQTP